MLNDSAERPRHKSEFTAIYDLLDPSPYYQGLEPSNYRMPDVVCGFLRAAATELSRARHAKGRLRVLDFASGYGANGALLRHDLTMADLYRHYGARTWHAGDGEAYWQTDKDFFAVRRAAHDVFEIAGLDIAANAVNYALAVGLIDRAFSDDLVSSAPGPAAAAYLAQVDIVIECGALGLGLRNAFSNVLNAADNGRRPWFVYSPRPDVDWSALEALWAAQGYVARACNQAPVPYRRALSASEEREMIRDCAALGRPAARTIVDGYLAVDLMLARPEDDDDPTHSVVSILFDQLPVVTA